MTQSKLQLYVLKSYFTTSVNVKKQYELIFIENLKLHTTYISCNYVWLATVNACEKINFLFLKKRINRFNTHIIGSFFLY